MPNRLNLLIYFICLSTACLAQRDDKETAETTVSPSDTVMINNLIRQSYDLRATHPAAAIEHCRHAISLSRQIKYRKGEGRALGVMGCTYFGQGNFANSLETSYEALKISEQLRDKSEIARSLNNVGAMAFHQHQYDKAVDYFHKAYGLAMSLNDQHTMARSLNNLGIMYMFSMPATDSAFAYTQRALAVSEKSGDRYYVATSNHTLGDLFVRTGNYKEALRKYRLSLSQSDKLSESMKVDIENNIAEVYLLINKTQEALTLLNKNVALATSKGFQQQLVTCYQLLSRAYKNENNAALALDYLERYTVLHDSLFNQESSERFAIIQSQSDLDSKQTQIELLTKDTLLNKDEMNRQQTRLYTAIGGLIGIIFLAGILVYGYQRIERTNVLLKQRTAELARINSTKDKLFSIISHDFRSPLNSLKGVLALVENKHLNREEFAVLAEKLRKNFNAVSNDLENLLQWSMTQLQGIQTHSARIDVQPIVEEHITVFQEIARAKNVQLRNHISSNLYGVADEDHIRLVLRNLINNAIKFTPPGGKVDVSATTALDSPFITIQVSDTGVGIASEQLEALFHKDRSISTMGTNQEKGVGLGLLLCHEFVENNGGQLLVASEPGKGSTFSFTLRAA